MEEQSDLVGVGMKIDLRLEFCWLKAFSYIFINQILNSSVIFSYLKNHRPRLIVGDLHNYLYNLYIMIVIAKYTIILVIFVRYLKSEKKSYSCHTS